jgi:hypothetical protein
MTNSDSNLLIRRSDYNDIKGICELYDNKEPDIMQWVLSGSQDNQEELCSYVAINKQDEIVGHIGYVESKYRFNGSAFLGIHPIEWRVRSDCKGSIGFELITKVTGSGDFNIIIGGTKEAQFLYPILGFKKLDSALVYSRIINYSAFLVSAKSIKKKILTLRKAKKRISLRNKGYSGSDISVQSVKMIDQKFHLAHSSSKLSILTDDSKTEWLIKCPVHDKYIIQVDVLSEKIGYAVLLYNSRTQTVRIISIVSKQEDIEIYGLIIRGIIGFCKKIKAIDINILSSNPVITKAIERQDFYFLGEKSIFAKNNNRDALSRDAIKDIDLSYVEGDIGYRF